MCIRDRRYARLARACRFCPPEAGEQEAFQALLTAVETLKQQCAIPTLKGALHLFPMEAMGLEPMTSRV